MIVGQRNKMNRSDNIASASQINAGATGLQRLEIDDKAVDG